MNREEEAIEYFKSHRKMFCDDVLKNADWPKESIAYHAILKEKSFYDMAIKALEQEPCEDWCDVPSDEMTLEQARQAVKDLRKKVGRTFRARALRGCSE